MTEIRNIPESEVYQLLEKEGREISVPAGTRLFEPGGDCAMFLVVTKGRVRVQMISDTGREIVLYRVGPGETCVLTTSCLLNKTSYRAEGIAETDIRALVLENKRFNRMLDTSSAFRKFVFAAYSNRFSDLMMLVEEVVFRRIDIRLAKHLMLLSDGNGCVNRTHQEIAVELGSAREVISRQLKEFERRGLVSLSRGSVALENCGRLRQLTGETSEQSIAAE